MKKGFIYQGHTSYQNPFCEEWECSDNQLENSFKDKIKSDEIIFPKEVVHPMMPNFLKFLYEECNSFEEEGDIDTSMIKIYNHSIFFLLFFYKKYHHEKMIVEKEIEERFKREIYQADGQFYRMITLRGTPVAGIILKSKIKEIYFLLNKQEAESQSEKVENAFLDLATYAIMTIII